MNYWKFCWNIGSQKCKNLFHLLFIHRRSFSSPFISPCNVFVVFHVDEENASSSAINYSNKHCMYRNIRESKLSDTKTLDVGVTFTLCCSCLSRERKKLHRETICYFSSSFSTLHDSRCVTHSQEEDCCVYTWKEQEFQELSYRIVWRDKQTSC